MKKINQSGFGHIELMLVLVAVGIIGFGVWRVMSSDQLPDNRQAAVTSQSQQSEAEELPSDVSGLRTLEEIQVLAAESSSEAILGIELEVEDGVVVYSVHLADGSVLYFDASTGEVLQLSDDNDDEIGEDASTIPGDFVTGVSLQQALDIAKEKRPNSVVKKIEFEVEDGVVVYSVRFTDDSRVDVNALDGTIQRLRDEAGTDVIKVDDDFDDDGVDNSVDDDDDDDGIRDEEDSDDDNDGIEDEEDDDDDNDGLEDDEDDDDDESDDDKDEDRSGSNSGSGSN